MSTDQNSTRDRSRDQVRISGGPGAPGETPADTVPSAAHDATRVEELGGGKHAPTDPGTDGTHTAGTHSPTEPGAHDAHTEAGAPASQADRTHATADAALDRDDTARRSHDDPDARAATDDAASADGLSGKPIVTADPAVPGEPAADRNDHREPHDVEPHSATVSREPAVPATTATTPAAGDKPFFDGDLLDVLNTRWKEVQASFVDNPHDAVTRADLLVAETVEQITTRWSEHQQQLQGRWSRGTDGDTEDLRQALRDYRDFFQKLLSLGN